MLKLKILIKSINCSEYHALRNQISSRTGNSALGACVQHFGMG